MNTIRNIARKIRHKIFGRSPATVSYSQAGEDAIVRFLFFDKGINPITYLDIGTNEPDANNNTYLFYRNGSRGVCVEADVTLIKKIKKIRPRDKVLNYGVAVGDQSKGSGPQDPVNGQLADFYIFDVKGLNTFDKEEAIRREAFGTYKIADVVKVQLISINELISGYFDRCPDFLSLDIEGLDLEVLRSLNYAAYPIPVICVETCQYSENHIRPKDSSIADFLGQQGYEIYADTYINTIFVNREWFYKE